MQTPQRPSPSLGLTPDADSLRQWQATRFHFAALRQPGHLAPARSPPPAMATWRGWMPATATTKPGK